MQLEQLAEEAGDDQQVLAPVRERLRARLGFVEPGEQVGDVLPYGRPPTGEPVELAAIVIFRIADGRLAERWAGWKPGRAPQGAPRT